MLSQLSYERRALIEQARLLLGGSSRFVDLAIELVAVDGPGWERIGGRWDRVAGCWCDEEPEEYTVWEVGQNQILPILGEGRIVCVGAMGSGKSEVLARAAIARAIRRAGHDIGVLAPTGKRIDVVESKINRLIPQAWVAARLLSKRQLILVNECRLEYLATKEYSQQTGSPVQGQTWSDAFPDEEQDMTDGAIADIMARLRGAPDGKPNVVSSCTLKDNPEWRERKLRYERQKGTTLYRMSAFDNPFVPASFWEELKEQYTERQWRMRVLALDCRPEAAVYPYFRRDDHLRPLPQIGVRDVTEAITGGRVLVGYDPGTLQDTSILLKAFLSGQQKTPTWWVVGECITRPGSAERHAVDLEQMLTERWGYLASQCVIRADPYGDTESRPHISVYREFRQRGFRIEPAVYRKTGNAATAHLAGMLPREPRIAVVNALLKSATGSTRLYIDEAAGCRQLVAALETQERDAAGKAETQRKGKNDTSHATAALGYGIYPYENRRVRMDDNQQAGG